MTARRELGRFAAVGGLATAVSAALFNLLVHADLGVGPVLNDHPLAGYVVANAVGMVVSYVGARRWVFPHRPPRGSLGGAVGFVAVNLASWVVPLGCLFLSRSALGLDSPFADNVAANVVGLGLGMVTRFVLLRRAVFTRPTRLLPVPREAVGTACRQRVAA